jgi:hypothetical protein
VLRNCKSRAHASRVFIPAALAESVAAERRVFAPRPRGHRLLAEGFGLSLGDAQRLDQGQDCGMEGREPIPGEALREKGSLLLAGPYATQPPTYECQGRASDPSPSLPYDVSERNEDGGEGDESQYSVQRHLAHFLDGPIVAVREWLLAEAAADTRIRHVLGQ